jgi:hypothetical protein
VFLTLFFIFICLLIIKVHIKRKENERAESVRKHSYMHMKNMEKAESWVPLKVHDMGKNIHNCVYIYMIFSI